MRTGALKNVVIAAIAMAAPGAARSIETSGWVGGQGERVDLWVSETDQTTGYRLHLDAGLNLSGNLVAPGTLDWSAALAYGRNRSEFLRSGYDTGQLTYSVAANAFESRESVFSLRGAASRVESDLTQFAPGVADSTGSTITQSYSLSSTIHLPQMPVIQVGASLTDSANTGYFGQGVDRQRQVLDALMRHGNAAVSYELTYQGVLESGSEDVFDARTQTLGVNAKGILSDASEWAVTGRSYRRTPDGASTNAVHIDDTQFSTMEQTRLDGFSIRSQYDYGHLVWESSSLPNMESTRHGVSTLIDRRLAPEWTLIGRLAAGASEDRLGSAETSGTGESIGANLRWTRGGLAQSYGVEGGARVGLVQPASGPDLIGWGGTAIGTASVRTQRLTTYGASYRVDYDANMDAAEGWTLAQRITADCSTRVAGDLSVHASVWIDARRGHNALLGDSANRSANANATLRWRRHEVGLGFNLADGLAGALSDPIRTDGLFIPAEYQTHSRSAALTATSALSPTLNLHALARYTSFETPGLIAQSETVFLGRLTYRIGQLSLVLEDRYAMASYGTAETSTNEAMVKLVRAFNF